MSRRWASWADPADAALADYEAMRYGTQTRRERRMPGCQERCCGGRADVYADWMAERLDWQISGWDLVPVLAGIVLVMAVMVMGWRLGGGWPW